MKARLGTRRSYAMIVAALAVATVGGLLALWPRGEAPPLRFFQALDSSQSGEILSAHNFGCNVTQTNKCQRLVVEITSGPDQGRKPTIELGVASGRPAYSEGDGVVVAPELVPAGFEGAYKPRYQVIDFERKPPLLWLTIAFAALVILFGRLRGALSLVGMAISLAIVLLFVVPAILRDSPPLAVALVGSMAVMLTTIPLAHGLGPKSLATMAGIAVSLVLIIALAVLFSDLCHLTGITSEEASYIASNPSTQGVNFQSLLIAGMVIGALGVLDDVAVSQASTVLALRAADPSQDFGELFRGAIGVGRDHVSAAVNTLVLAYAGGSLVTLLVLGSGQLSFFDAVDLEIVATVIVSTLVGSIGLICAVPITTALAALLAEGVPAEELAADPHLSHAH